ncbi:hypothetical protein CLPU_4c02240 [Gottschalkia purinilytica]|uniref:DUF4330 domain-containing protein n=1 Tax=Gottschalkia purinilytica TaxID=1503 RepID=A0A0L0WCI5_GOTPU|nr:DUF4330 domain-containing protein [Gottschalkia purinilytica]KNF09178.1 hypothetical protein CLPU_4c02240 [Gottschalkia purinilytica]
MKKKFNWIDFGIIFILIAVVAAGSLYFVKKKGTVTNNVSLVPVEVTVRVEGVKKESVDVINKGNIFSDSDNNEIFGEVIDKKVEEAYDFVETSDGRIVKSKMPDRYTIYLTLKGEGQVTDDFVKLGGREVRYEGTIRLKDNITAIETKVTDIKIPNNK